MVLDKLFAIKIKRQDGSYSDRIPISALAQNIQWDASHSLTDILGNVKNNKTIQGQIDDLQNNKISENSLNTYVGTKLQEDAAEWLEQNLNPDEVLKKTDLYSDDSFKSSQASMEPKEVEWRQYPVVRDQQDNLSVNVPWTDTDTPADIQHIWSGICSTEVGVKNKVIVLDKIDNFEIKHGAIIAVYFTMGNTIQSPTITIQGFGNAAMPIYYAVDKETILEMDANTPEPWYTFTPGLKFFTCRNVGNKLGWLLTTVDYSLISHLNQTIAKQDSPEFSGTPTAPTAAAGDNSNQIATTKFVHDEVDNILSNTYLKTNATMPVNSQNPPASPSFDRQYPVVKDNEGKLSVNVPWAVSDADAAVQHIWTGVCNTAATTATKNITLDNGSNFSVVNGATLIVYFTNGNTASTPMLNINNDVRNVLYQSDANTVTPLQASTPTAISNWGAGLKIFTYYSQNSIGWIMQSPDMASIRYLLTYKADLNSPTFTGSPTAPTPVVGDNSKKLATTAFVNNAIANTSQKNSQNISKDFDVNSTYVAGDYVYYNGKLYKFVKTHAAGDWDRSEVDEISITGDIQSATQNLNSILVNNSSEVSLTNKGQLSHFNDGMGFIKTSDTGDLIKYQYNYSNNTHKTIDPYIRTGSGSYGNGKSLIGLKFRLINSSEVPLSSVYNKFYITTEGDSPQLVYDINSISGIWTQASLCVSYPASSSELSHIKLYLHADPNYDYGNATVTVEIKDFYIYNLTDEIADNANSRNYIINEQNRNYQNGTVIYSLPNYGTDKTLTQEGKAADAKVVGDVFNDVLIKNENEYKQRTFTNLLSLNNMSLNWNRSGNLILSTINYRKYKITDGQSIYMYFPTVQLISYPGQYLIGFKYKFYSTENATVPVDYLYFSGPNIYIDGQETQSWKNFSCLYTFKENDNIGNFYIKKEDIAGLAIDTHQSCFELKDLYIYQIPSLAENDYLINYICKQQSENYQDGTVTYIQKNYETDKLLNQEGKIADSKTVGKIFNDVLVKEGNEQSRTFTNLQPFNRTWSNINSSLSTLDDIHSNYIKLHIYKTDQINDKSYVMARIPNPIISETESKKFMVGFKYKITENLPLPDNFNYFCMYEVAQGSLLRTTIALKPSSNWENFYCILDQIHPLQYIASLQFRYKDMHHVTIDTTLELKDFYIYQIPDDLDTNDPLIHYIQLNQLRNYKNFTVTYDLSSFYTTDKTLSLEGKAADAAAVGNAIITPPDFLKLTSVPSSDFNPGSGTSFFVTMEIPQSGWYSLSLVNTTTGTIVMFAKICILLNESWRELASIMIPESPANNLEWMSPWLYFKKGTSVNFQGNSHAAMLYFCPCM